MNRIVILLDQSVRGNLLCSFYFLGYKISNKIYLQFFLAQYLYFKDQDFINHKLHEQFIEKRIVESKSIWDTINKRRLPTFANNEEVVTVKIRNQLLNIKAERKLCQDLQSKIEI